MAEINAADMKNLYHEALYEHFITLGYSEWKAKAMANEIIGETKTKEIPLESLETESSNTM